MRSLGLATDLLAREGLSTVERHPDCLMVRTPDQPDFWFGNMMVVLGPPGDPEAEAARFRAGFPEARHLCIAWDAPNPEVGPLRPAWAALGAEVEEEDVLTRQGPPPPRPLPPGYDLREFHPRSDRDWAESVRLSLAADGEEGHKEEPHLAYLRRRVEGRRRQAAAGRLRWWGAFQGNDLAAQMGLVEGLVNGRPLARFQHVNTHPGHRRQGLCAALLSHVGGAARSPTLVILADRGGDAGRIYRRAGFARRERVAGVLRPGY